MTQAGWPVAALAAAVALVAWFGPLEHASLYRKAQIRDTPEYHRYAAGVAAGRLPYRDFKVEYPPLAFAAFLPPWAAGSKLAPYTHAFSALMGACAALTAALAALAARALGSTRRALAAGLGAALAPLLVGSVALTRFDLWPTLLVALALALAVRGHDTGAALALGLGTAAKLWPLLCAPALLAVAARRGGGVPWRPLAALAAGTLLPFAVVLAISPSGLRHALAAQLSRPLQLETLGASVLLLLRDAGLPWHYHVVTGDGSQNLVGPHAGLAATASGAAAGLTILAVVACGVRAALRARPADAAAAALPWVFAAVVASVALGRVLSPQYLLWLVPFPLLVAGSRGALAAILTALALALTQLEFPGRYWSYVYHLQLSTTAIVALRDAVLVALLATLVVPARRIGRGARHA